MSDDISTDDLFKDDAPAKPAAKKGDTKPAAKAKRGPRPVPQEIDNAVDITAIHWECACGNTNTHDLRQCGKCRKPRFTTD